MSAAIDYPVPGNAIARPGVEVTVKGLGRCRYIGVQLGPDGQAKWVDVMHPGTARGVRSVTPDRITRVHRTEKLK